MHRTPDVSRDVILAPSLADTRNSGSQTRRTIRNGIRIALIAAISLYKPHEETHQAIRPTVTLSHVEGLREAPHFRYDEERGYYFVVDGAEVSLPEAFGFVPGKMIDEIAESEDTLVFRSGHFSNPITKEKSKMRIPKNRSIAALRKALAANPGSAKITASLDYEVDKRGPLIRLLPIKDGGTQGVEFEVRWKTTPEAPKYVSTAGRKP